MLELLTVKQVADLKGCSEQYVGKLVGGGILQSAKDGGTRMIPLENLDIKLVNAIPANGKAKIIPSEAFGSVRLSHGLQTLRPESKA